MASPTPPTESRPTRAPQRRRSRLAIWLVSLVIGITCTAVVHIILRDRANAGIGLPAYSVYSDAPEGYAQAAVFLGKLGWQAVPVTRPIHQTRFRGLLILAEPKPPLSGVSKGPTLSDADVDGLLDWVRQGNTLLLSGLRNSRLHDKLGIVVADQHDHGDAVFQATPGAVGEYTAGLAHIGVEHRAKVSAAKGVPLWWHASEPGAMVVRHGNGRVLVVPDPSLLTHRGLLREDNAVFLYNVAALDASGGEVYFDEYHHGIRSGGGYWNYLRFHNQHWIVLQLLLIAGMGWWMVGRRLGPAVPMAVTKVADGVDYASSVARIYQKADVRPLVAAIHARHFHETLKNHLRLRRNATTPEILAAWRQRYRDIGTRELSELLDAAQTMTLDNTSARQLTTLVQHFDNFLDQYVRKTNPSH